MRHSTTWIVAAAAALLCLSLPARGFAETFFIDPEEGSSSNDGSQSDPWETLEQVIEDKKFETRDWDGEYDESKELQTVREGAPIEPGDTLVLLSGHHGDVTINGAYNEQSITLRAGSGETPTLSRIRLRAAANWAIEGLTVSPSFADEYQRRTMIEVDSHDFHGPSHDITIQNNEVYSIDDASPWSADDWDQKAANGISSDGDGVRIEDNTVRNVNDGISASADNVFVGHNTVDGFAGAGLRGFGDNGSFVYNTVKNAWDVNDKDVNGFESFSSGPDGIGTGEVTGMVVRGNLIINHEDPTAQMRANLQGIGCFDGMFVDWTVENNVIITDQWHGITFQGARDTQIVNNTLIDLDDSDPGPPWIKVDAHKDGTASDNVTVRNNLTTALSLADEGVTADHNIEYDDPSAHFVDPDGNDLHLLESSSAVDAGSDMLAPDLDRDRVPRPQGDAVDVGAYEWHEGDVDPVDAGRDAGGGGDAAMDTGSGGDEDTGSSGGDISDDTVGGDTSGGDNDAAGDADAGEDAGSAVSDDEEGCGCSTTGGSSGFPSAILFLLVWLGVRRRNM